MPDDRKSLLALTAQIVAAHVGCTTTKTDDLCLVIETVYNALVATTVEHDPLEEPRVPAVPIRKSVFPDYIVCLEDGKKLKMLKRHLQTAYGLSPHDYRQRWGLPRDYPMVAPAYAEQRSELAKKIGLGTSNTRLPDTDPVAAAIPARRGRPAKRPALPV